MRTNESKRGLFHYGKPAKVNKKTKVRYAYMVIRNEGGNRQDYIFKTLNAAFKFIKIHSRKYLSDGCEVFRVDSKNPYGYTERY